MRASREQPFESHAQNLEDVVLWRALGDIERGTYVDVGAYDPVVDSVTWAFYLRGWRGVAVEPVPSHAEQLRTARPEDITIQAAAGRGHGVARLFSAPGTGISTLVAALGEHANRRYGIELVEIEVRVAPLDDLLDESGFDRRPIHFCKIDVEGSETDVLAGFDLQRWAPWVLVVEATEPNQPTPTHDAWEPGVLEAGYRFCLFDGLNRFYVHGNQADRLASRLSYPACVLDEPVARIHQASRQTAEFDGLLTQQTARVAELESVLAHQAARVAELESVLAHQAARIAELDRRNAEHSTERQRLAEENGHLRELTSESRAELDAIRATLSWRITRPLRAVRGVRRTLGRASPVGDPDSDAAPVEPRVSGRVALAISASTRALKSIDISTHNAGESPPTFDFVVSQVVSATQFSHPDFERLRRVMFPGAVRIPWGSTEATVEVLHRKVWEFVYVLRAAEQFGRLEPGRRAIGFGVGQEPIPAALARLGLSVVATDLDSDDEASAAWVAGAQHMSNPRSLSRPNVVPDDVLERQVTTRFVDMNTLPRDLGTFDLVWSCCALEHLGSPEAGLDFVLHTLDHLEPGGVSVHTTELELTRRAETADYGNLAVYRKDDLERLADDARSRGFEIETNWYVSLETPADRWISVPPYPHDDPAHLKLAIGDSVSTSVALLVRRPPHGGH